MNKIDYFAGQIMSGLVSQTHIGPAVQDKERLVRLVFTLAEEMAKRSNAQYRLAYIVWKDTSLKTWPWFNVLEEKADSLLLEGVDDPDGSREYTGDRLLVSKQDIEYVDYRNTSNNNQSHTE